MTIRVILADDTDLTLLGAQTVLINDHRFEVVATARRIDDLLLAVSTKHPDVVILNEWIHSIVIGLHQQCLMPPVVHNTIIDLTQTMQ